MLLVLDLTTLLLLRLDLLLLRRSLSLALLTDLLTLSVSRGIALLCLSGTRVLLLLFCFLWWLLLLLLLLVPSLSPVTLCARINGEAEQQSTCHC